MVARVSDGAYGMCYGKALVLIDETLQFGCYSLCLLFVEGAGASRSAYIAGIAIGRRLFIEVA